MRRFLLVPLLCAVPNVAWAQPRPPLPILPPQSSTELKEVLRETLGAPRRTFRELSGVRRASELLESPDVGERLRGIERLAATGTDEALRQLVDAVADGTSIRNDPRTLLAVVRALADFAGEDDARKALTSVMNASRCAHPAETRCDDPTEQPLELLARATAAMALARAGTDGALTPLVTAVISGGPTGDMAKQALLAYPPESLRVFARGRKALMPAVMDLLGELGDIRAIPLLRLQLKRKLHFQLIAARNLARLGDGTVAARARGWVADPSSSSVTRRQRARVGAAEILIWLDAADRDALLSELLSDAGERSAGLTLAEQAPSLGVAPTLEAMLAADVTVGEKRRAIALLGRTGAASSVKALLAATAEPALAHHAAFALARIAGPAAAEALAKGNAATSAEQRRLFWRGSLLRFAERGEAVAGLATALADGLASDAPADRAIAAYGLALLGERRVSELLESAHQEVAIAAARAALAMGPAQFDGCPAGLGEGLLAVACGAKLLQEDETISTLTLANVADAGGALAPMAALRLAARDPRSFRARVEQLLAGTDPVIRAHVVFGLALSPELDATALLINAYRHEATSLVRRAIVRALSQRKGQLRHATLELAGRLDPDAEARNLARSALAGRQHPVRLPPDGARGVWVHFEHNDAPARGSLARAAYVLRSDGLALPVVSDPDGGLLVSGLGTAGEIAVRLAPPVQSVNP